MVAFDQWLDHCCLIDILITSTATDTALLNCENFGPVAAKRAASPLFIIDIAVPRNVDPRVNRLESVYLYDMDSLQLVAQQAMAMRRQQVALAEEIIAEHLLGFQEIFDRGVERKRESIIHPPLGETPSPTGAV